MILAPCAEIAIESGVCVYKWVHAGILETSELRIAKPCAWFRCIYLGLSPHQFETEDRPGRKQNIGPNITNIFKRSPNISSTSPNILDIF